VSTASKVATLQVIRTRLLSYTPSSGQSGATRLGTLTGAASDGKLYIGQAPDTVTYPYGVLRWLDWRQQGEDGGYLRRPIAELALFHRPRAQEAALQAIADQFERALRKWTADAPDQLHVYDLSRQTIHYEAPADRELVQERLLITCVANATYLTQDSPA
jgi:hypothetical protein